MPSSSNRQYATVPEHPKLDRIYAALDASFPLDRRRYARRQKLPRLLYKFRSIHPAQNCGAARCLVDPSVASQDSLEKLRDIIVRSDLWLSSPADFNDPFDATAEIVGEGNVSIRKQRFSQMVKDHEPHLSWKKQEARVSALMKRPANEMISAFQTSLNNLRNALGVYSLAGDSRSILMWSHYAANHAGVCLVFNPMEDFRVFSNALPVGYIDDLPKINWMELIEKAIPPMLLTKFSLWHYEKERRIIINGEAHKYLRFRPNALIAIITGCRAPKYVLDTVATLLAERNAANLPSVRHYTASQHPSKFKLVIRKAAAI